MKAYTLDQLKFAEELAFPKDIRRLFEKHTPDCWPSYYLDWLKRYDGSLLRYVFHFSRADYRNGLGEAFEGIIDDLIGDYGK